MSEEPGPTVFWESGEPPAASTPMEVFPAEPGLHRQPCPSVDPGGFDVIGGDDLDSRPRAEGAPQGFAEVRFFIGRFAGRITKRMGRPDKLRHNVTDNAAAANDNPSPIRAIRRSRATNG